MHWGRDKTLGYVFTLLPTTFPGTGREEPWERGCTKPLAYDVEFSLSTLYFKTVDSSLTRRIKQWERNDITRLSKRLWEGERDEIRAPPKTPAWEAIQDEFHARRHLACYLGTKPVSQSRSMKE